MTIPLGNFLRENLPEIEPLFLVSRYTAPLLGLHEPPFSALVWEERPTLQAEAIVHVFPRAAIAWAAWRQGIPKRVGTARRWYHTLTCTDRPRVSRRYSGKHEAALNFALLAPLLPPPLRAIVEAPTWEFLLQYRARLRASGSLPPAVRVRLDGYAPLVVLHVGTAGGAPQWPLAYWAEVAHYLQAAFPRIGLVLTGTAAESVRLAQLRALRPPLRWIDLSGQLDLAGLVALLGQVHLVIAGSTGPLHIAAAVDTPTVGIFPATAAMGPWRWRPLSPYSQVVGGTPLCTRCTAPACRCLAQITPESVAALAEAQLKQRLSASAATGE